MRISVLEKIIRIKYKIKITWIFIPCSFDALEADFSSYALFLYNICGACAPDPAVETGADEAPPAEDPANLSAAAIAALVAAMVGATRS